MKHDFNMVSLLVLLSVLAAGLIAIFFFGRMEEKKMKKQNGPKVFRIPPVADAKLDLDVTEEFYHK